MVIIMANSNKVREIDILVGLKDFLTSNNAPVDTIQWVDKKIDQNNRKAEARKSIDNEKSKVNEDIKMLILEILENLPAEEKITVTDMLNFDNIKEYTYKEKVDGEEVEKHITNQKITYILTKIINDKVERTIEKKKAYYKLKVND